VWVASLALALVGASILWFSGASPWALVVVVVLVLTMVIAQRTSWPSAFAGSVLVTLAAFAVLLRVAPYTGLDLAVTGGISLGFAAIGGIVILARVRDPRMPTQRAATVVAPAVALPALIVVLGGPIAIALGAGPTWAMRNDAVWNMVTARLMIDDAGLRADQHPNSSPLTGGLIAMAAAPGRAMVSPGDLLQHDVGRGAELWLLMVLATAALAGLIALRTTHGASRVARFAAAVVTAMVPLTFFIAGFAFQFGFANSTLTLVVLLASWLAWLETRVAPLPGSAILSLATIAMLATWAPLAAVPGALAVVALFSRVSALVRQRGTAILWWSLAAAPVPLYVAIVTLDDLRRDGGALVVDGGIQPLQPTHVLIIGAVSAVGVVFHAVRNRAPHLLIGFAIIGIATVGALAYLVAQRASGGAYFWGYYPIKMSWLVCCLLIVVLTATLLAEVAALRAGAAMSVVAGVSVVVMVGALMIQVPPPSLRSLFPPLDIVRGTGVADSPQQARDLFEVSEDGRRVLVSHYVDPQSDRFMNSWLLQLESEFGTDPIRYFSYVLDPDDDRQVCEAIRAWAGPVDVHTSDSDLEGRLRAICGDLPFTVVTR
jgi:hypothetical protein